MCFSSFSFPSVAVGTFWAWWYKVLIRPGLCSGGWGESKRRNRLCGWVFCKSVQTRVTFDLHGTVQEGQTCSSNSLAGELDVFIVLMMAVKASPSSDLILTYVSSTYLYQWPWAVPVKECKDLLCNSSIYRLATGEPMAQPYFSQKKNTRPLKEKSDMPDFPWSRDVSWTPDCQLCHTKAKKLVLHWPYHS